MFKFWWNWKAEAQRQRKEKEIALDALRRNQEAMKGQVEKLTRDVAQAENANRDLLSKVRSAEHALLLRGASRRVEVARRAGMSPDALKGGLRLCPGSEQYKAITEVIDGLFVEETNEMLKVEGDVGAVRNQQGVAAGILLVKEELEGRIAEAQREEEKV